MLLPIPGIQRDPIDQNRRPVSIRSGNRHEDRSAGGSIGREVLREEAVSSNSFFVFAIFVPRAKNLQYFARNKGMALKGANFEANLNYQLLSCSK